MQKAICLEPVPNHVKTPNFISDVVVMSVSATNAGVVMPMFENWYRYFPLIL